MSEIVYDRQGLDRLILAVVESAVGLLNFRGLYLYMHRDGTPYTNRELRREALKTARWLREEGIDWMLTLDVPVQESAFDEWLKKQMARWERSANERSACGRRVRC